MSQQINLFSPAFRKRRIVLTAARLAMLAGLAVVGMLGYWFIEYQVIKGLKQELATAQNLLQAQRSHVERIAATRGARPKDKTLEADTRRLEAELELARERLETLAGGAGREAGGFAEYLRAFSRQSVDGLWLTGLDIRTGGDMTIRGRAVNPGLVPGYIQRLDREDILRGRAFGALRIARPEADRAAAAGPEKAPAAPRFLEFSLATAEPKAGAGAAERTP